jgi:hypothetical protein
VRSHDDEIALDFLRHAEDHTSRITALDPRFDGYFGGDLVEPGQGVADHNFRCLVVRGRHDMQSDDPSAAVPGDLTRQVERAARGRREVRRVQYSFDRNHGDLLRKRATLLRNVSRGRRTRCQRN